MPHVNALGLAAAAAAYRYGDEWLAALRRYLTLNRDTLVNFVQTRVPELRTTVPQATYLAWLDCRGAIPGSAHKFFLERARVAVNEGEQFGAGGGGFCALELWLPALAPDVGLGEDGSRPARVICQIKNPKGLADARGLPRKGQFVPFGGRPFRGECCRIAWQNLVGGLHWCEDMVTQPILRSKKGRHVHFTPVGSGSADHYLHPLLSWFSDYVYSRLLKQAEDHLLFKLHRHLDFTRLEQGCAGFHHASGPGAVPSHVVARLVRAVLVGHLYGWSLRQLEQQVRFNLIVKWFVGYGLHEPGPDHTTLERFELWVCTHHHRDYFDEVLHQIDQQFPEDRQQVQLGDTFAVRATGRPRRARRPGDPYLPSHLAARSRKCARHWPAPIAHQVQVPALFSADTDPHAFRLSRAGAGTAAAGTGGSSPRLCAVGDRGASGGAQR